MAINSKYLFFKDGGNNGFQQVNCPCNSNDPGCNSIQIPPIETTFTSQSCINFTRSSPTFPTLDCNLANNNYREQLNLVSSFLDASQVYGNNKSRSHQLRSFSNGLLKTSQGVSPKRNYLPVSLYSQNDGSGLRIYKTN